MLTNQNKRGPKPKGLVSFHLKIVKSDLEYLQQMSRDSNQSTNSIIRDLISGFVEWWKLLTPKNKTAQPGERTPIEAVSSYILDQKTGEVNSQPENSTVSQNKKR